MAKDKTLSFSSFDALAHRGESSPQRVLKTHSSDEIAHLFADLGSTPERTGFPSPEGGRIPFDANMVMASSM
jgi:hypothetical protein